MTESERAIRANQRSITSLEKRVFALEQKLERITTVNEGLTASLRSNAETLNSIKQSLARIEERMKVLNESDVKNLTELSALGKRQGALEKQVNSALSTQSKNQEKLAQSIANAITKERFDKAISQITEELDLSRSAFKSLGVDALAAKYDSSEPEALLAESIKMIETKNYDGAKSRLAYLVDKKYKPAEVAFRIGSIYYFQEDNERALGLFKDSAQQDDEAYYMPILLFYSGICHERQKGYADAKRFYETLIQLFPEDKIAESAKKRMAKLPASG
ncbi:MAG: tetratricopeptide repeat protein [Helicobacteraceae bacterium]|nr:tetratricopeptide repeat protein [Helicobacteraceae bacterium]